MMRRPSPEVLAAVLAGALSGVVGAFLFATAHAIIIVPIWDRMTSGLIFGAIAGAGAVWAFAECYPATIRTRTKRSVGIGAGFGALGWQITHRFRRALAGAVAGLLLIVAMAGPVPVGRSTRAFNIFLAVFPAAVLGGIALGLFSPVIFARITRGREHQASTRPDA